MPVPLLPDAGRRTNVWVLARLSPYSSHYISLRPAAKHTKYLPAPCCQIQFQCWLYHVLNFGSPVGASAIDTIDTFPGPDLVCTNIRTRKTSHGSGSQQPKRPRFSPFSPTPRSQRVLFSQKQSQRTTISGWLVALGTRFVLLVEFKFAVIAPLAVLSKLAVRC